MGAYGDKDTANHFAEKLSQPSNMSTLLENFRSVGAEGRSKVFADHIKLHVDENKRVKLSKYSCVTFNKKSMKWEAFMQIGNMKCTIGSYDDEETAQTYRQRAVTLKEEIRTLMEEECGNKMKRLAFATFIKEHIDENKRVKTSKYAEVSRSKGDKGDKWRASIRIDGLTHCIGFYDDEETARAFQEETTAHKDEIEALLATKSDRLDKISAFAAYVAQNIDPNRRQKTSKYIGVSLGTNSNKWHAWMKLGGFSYFVGFYDDEETANEYLQSALAHKADIVALLEAEGNRMDKISTFAAFIAEHVDANKHQKTSKFKGVSWSSAHQKWRVHIRFGKRQYLLGKFAPWHERMAAWTYEWVNGHRAELVAIKDAACRGTQIRLLLALQQSFHDANDDDESCRGDDEFRNDESEIPCHRSLQSDDDCPVFLATED